MVRDLGRLLGRREVLAHGARHSLAERLWLGLERAGSGLARVADDLVDLRVDRVLQPLDGLERETLAERLDELSPIGPTTSGRCARPWAG